MDSAYRGETSRQGWTTEADLLDGQRTDAEAVHAAIAAVGSVVLVAETDSRLAACCHLEGRPGGVVNFGMFAVRPGVQGRGLGGTVIAEAERVAAAQLGATSMRMQVISRREELIAWYERLGYRRTGEREPFPYGDERFGLPKRRDLEFVVLARSLAPSPT